MGRKTVIREKTEEIRTRLKDVNARNDEKIRKVMVEEWPDETYTRTRVETGNPAMTEGNLVIYTEDKTMETEINRKLGKRC